MAALQDGLLVASGAGGGDDEALASNPPVARIPVAAFTSSRPDEDSLGVASTSSSDPMSTTTPIELQGGRECVP